MIIRYRGEQICFEQTVELGSVVSAEPSLYVDGPAWTMDRTTVAVSDVNLTRPGDYAMHISNPFRSFVCMVHVKDTIPPDLEIADTAKTVLAAGREYDLSVIGADANDLSGMAFVSYSYDGKAIDSLYFPDPGTYSVTVTATDGSANRTTRQADLFVDRPPIFFGLHDQYVVKGSSASDLDPVFAYDDVDGGLTFDIKSDTSRVDFDKVGVYPVSYAVQDGYGISSNAVATIHVVATSWQADAHAYNTPLSRVELARIIEEDYFDYQPLTEEDKSWVVDNLDVTLVNILREDEEGNVSSGSAFIFDITEDYIYLVSVYHVTGFLEGEDVRITFYDGSRIDTVMHSLRLSAGNEASLFRIPVKDVSYHTLVRLRKAYRDPDIYRKLKKGSHLLEYCKNWRGGELPEIIKDVDLIAYDLSGIQKIYVDDDSYYAVTRRSVGGMSGTAVYDLTGRLAGICSKTIYPLANEEARYRDGCDLVLMTDDLDMLMERTDELTKMEKRR